MSPELNTVVHSITTKRHFSDAYQSGIQHNAEKTIHSLFYPQRALALKVDAERIWSLLILNNFLSKGMVMGQSATDESKINRGFTASIILLLLLRWPPVVCTYPHTHGLLLLLSS